MQGTSKCGANFSAEKIKRSSSPDVKNLRSCPISGMFDGGSSAVGSGADYKLGLTILLTNYRRLYLIFLQVFTQLSDSQYT